MNVSKGMHDISTQICITFLFHAMYIIWDYTVETVNFNETVGLHMTIHYTDNYKYISLDTF